MEEKDILYEAYITIKNVEKKVSRAIELLDSAFSDLDRAGDALLEIAKQRKINMERGEE